MKRELIEQSMAEEMLRHPEEFRFLELHDFPPAFLAEAKAELGEAISALALANRPTSHLRFLKWRLEYQLLQS